MDQQTGAGETLERTTSGLWQKSSGYRFGGQKLLCLALLFITGQAQAQQFNSDNQWVAPHGVGTFIATVGEEYSAVLAVAALVPEWEFNVGVTHYYDDYDNLSTGHDTGSLYVKHRIRENDAQTAGIAIMGGTGVDPSHLEQGVATDNFQTWWANMVYTYAFRDGQITWDLLPGVLLSFDHDNQDESAWGLTYSSRMAFYGVIPQSALVAEVFGTAGEAEADPAYRFGVRWESKKWIVAATYSDALDGGGGAGFELGVMYLTEPRFCWGGCGR